MKCPKCKTDIKTNEKVCSNCGCKINLKMKKQHLKDNSIVEGKTEGLKEMSSIESNLSQNDSNYSIESRNAQSDKNKDSAEDLKEYLKSVLETEIMLRNSIKNIDNIDKETAQKPKYNPPKEPVYVQPKGQPKYDPPKVERFAIRDILEYVAVGFIAILFISLGIVFISFSLQGDEYPVSGAILCFLFMVLPGIIGMFLLIRSAIETYQYCKCSESNYKSYKNKYDAKCNEYKKLCEAEEEKFKVRKSEYEQTLSKYNVQYNDSLKRFKEKEIKSMTELNSKRKELSDKLVSLYSKNVIHEKYRNIEAVSAFYDYISQGLCSTLEGRDGAYNFYEERLKQEKADARIKELEANITKLEAEIKSKAEQERINQWLMSNQMSMLQHSIEFEAERLRDKYSDDLSIYLANN